MTKLSVIIPVYNASSNVIICLNSLFEQNFEDLEIICVNDGSTDDSLSILSSLEKEKGIKVVNQENKGVAAARNTGIDIANGEYIMFLDSDDHYTKNACQIVYQAISENNTDIGIFGFWEDNGVKLKSGNANKHLSKIIEKNKTPDIWKFQTFCWNKIYKKSFLDKYNIRFPVGVKTAEDGIFSLCCHFNNPKYCFINEPLYVYNKINQNSVTSNINAIQNDFFAFKTFFEMPIFKAQDIDTQLKVVEKFCSGIWSYYKKLNNANSHKKLDNDISEFLEFINKNYNETNLEKLKKYRQLKQRNKNIFQKIFNL